MSVPNDQLSATISPMNRTTKTTTIPLPLLYPRLGYMIREGRAIESEPGRDTTPPFEIDPTKGTTHYQRNYFSLTVCRSFNMERKGGS